MITLINWKNGGNIGHFLVLDGYFKGMNNMNYITYMDPWYGDHYQHNFESFKITIDFGGMKQFKVLVEDIK